MDYRMKKDPDFTPEKEWYAIDSIAASDEISIIQKSPRLTEVDRVVKKLLSKKVGCRILQSNNVISNLERLISSAPNMTAYLDTVIAQVYLHSQFPSDTPFRLIPTLLVGPPGIGKTYIINQVAKALKFPSSEIQLAQATEAFILSGCPRGYTNSSPGEFVDAIAKSSAINPIVILDEIDKAGYQQTDRPAVTGPLLRVLEQETARAFEDSSLRIPVDLQHISWIATANDLSGIPDAVLSRFHIIRIEDLSTSDKNIQIQQICQRVLERLEIDNIIDADVSTEAIEKYSHLSIRTWQQRLQLAIAEQFHRRGALNIKITAECMDRFEQKIPSRPIGFIR